MKNEIIETLLCNEDFVNWVKDPSLESDIYWEKWLENHQEYVTELQKARKVLQLLHFKEPNPIEEVRSRILGHVLNGKTSGTLQNVRSGKINVNLSYRSVISVAAVLLFLMTFSFLILSNTSPTTTPAPPEMVIKTTPYGRKVKCSLPDGSIVTLNSGSQIRYPKQFTEKYREVGLVGEAFFEVARNESQAFRVSTNNVRVIVIGTSFNVKAFPEEVYQEVALQSGSVLVEAELPVQSNSWILDPGEMAVFDSNANTLSRTDFDPDALLVWKDGVLYFKRANLNEFVNRIERWYDVEVSIDKSVRTDFEISGRFENETLENVLESLSFSTGLNYRLDGNKVMLLLKK